MPPSTTRQSIRSMRTKLETLIPGNHSSLCWLKDVPVHQMSSVDELLAYCHEYTEAELDEVHNVKEQEVVVTCPSCQERRAVQWSKVLKKKFCKAWTTPTPPCQYNDPTSFKSNYWWTCRLMLNQTNPFRMITRYSPDWKGTSNVINLNQCIGCSRLSISLPSTPCIGCTMGFRVRHNAVNMDVANRLAVARTEEYMSIVTDATGIKCLDLDQRRLADLRNSWKGVCRHGHYHRMYTLHSVLCCALYNFPSPCPQCQYDIAMESFDGLGEFLDVMESQQGVVQVKYRCPGAGHEVWATGTRPHWCNECFEDCTSIELLAPPPEVSAALTRIRREHGRTVIALGRAFVLTTKEGQVAPEAVVLPLPAEGEPLVWLKTLEDS